ncbi:hypothetical protein GGP41_002642 [Bipolaris sorokiniana]|uniref:Uncharacterized protein n=1 Tax=Cochliobolus sativus TaxID=45130 RepID=A0A8H5ZJH4_COCSA|nr:hypothetical protein GGP41_002642 [Bipolaris sorokiniana]
MHSIFDHVSHLACLYFHLSCLYRSDLCFFLKPLPGTCNSLDESCRNKQTDASTRLVCSSEHMAVVDSGNGDGGCNRGQKRTFWVKCREGVDSPERSPAPLGCYTSEHYHPNLSQQRT